MLAVVPVDKRHHPAPHLLQRVEGLVREKLKTAGFAEDSPKPIPNVSAARRSVTSVASQLSGTRKADVGVRLWDGRVLASECEVSNPEVNSIKRLTNDAAVKARIWREDFGITNIVPCAMLAGVLVLRPLKESQKRGLTLFWSHSVAETMAFIEATRPA